MLGYIFARILCFIMILFNVDFYDSLEDDENNNDDPDEYSQKLGEYHGNYCFQSNQS